MNLIQIPQDKTAVVWPAVRSHIYRAVEKADLMSFEPIERMALEGRAVLWVAYDGSKLGGAALTQIMHTEHRKILHIIAASGNLEVGKRLLSKIEDYGRDAGCVASRITGRLGWERALPDYKRKRAILEKALLHGR